MTCAGLARILRRRPGEIASAWRLREDASGLVRVKSGVTLMAAVWGGKIIWDYLILKGESGVSGA